MNLSALSRKLLRKPAKPARRSMAASAIEPLEDRIAPATLVSPTTVTYVDKNGDNVSVVITKNLFTTTNVAKVFTFDTGTATSGNLVQQQLELLDITKLGSAAKGIDITITATPVSGSPGIADVGYINASGIDLGNVTVPGDLGRIAAGDLSFSTAGLKSLTVDTLGLHGVLTQLSGGNLNSLIAGAVGSITVKGDIDGASIGIGGGAKGTLGTLTVMGSINGGSGAAAFSGSVSAQGNITMVTVDGSINGGPGGGAESGTIGTAGSIGSVTVDGSVVGGSGMFSGAILSTKGIGSVTIDIGLTGGSGPDSGQIGSASTIGSVTIGGSVVGGSGPVSGDILATGNIVGPVTINGSLTGGGGAGSGQIGSAASIGAVVIDGSMSAGAAIHAFRNLQSVTVNAGEGGISGSFIIADDGSIGSIAATTIVNSGIDAGGSIGAITTSGPISGSVFVAGIDLGASFGISGAGAFNSTNATFGFGSSKSGAAARIGNISASDIASSTFLAGVHGPGADGIFGTKDDLVPTGSHIGTITSPGGLDTVFIESGSIGATTTGAIAATNYIATDTAISAGGIGPITIIANLAGLVNNVAKTVVHAADGSVAAGGISNSMFISNAGIGPVNITVNGIRGLGENAGIASSTFQAGHAIGTITIVNNASGTGGTNYGIVNSTFNGGLNGGGATGDISVTLTDAGPDGNSAAIAYSDFDASVCYCMKGNFGAISAENADTAPTAAGILDSVFRAYGNIGPISATMDSGSPTAAAIEGTVFSAFGSIGAINVYGAVVPDNTVNPILPSRFLAGYDIGSDMIFGNEDLSAKSVALQSGQSVGDVTVTGYFQDSDIIASINPGIDYVFGAAANTNIGAGGSIGLVVIGANVSLDGNPFLPDNIAPHAIEAATFALGENESPSVTAFGDTHSIPVLLTDGGAGNVRITNLTPDIG